MKRHWTEFLTAGYLIIVAYTSLVPFDFAGSPPPGNAPTFLGVHVTIAGLPDILANLALYLPLGFLVRATLARKNVAPVSAAITTVFLATTISYSIELIQTFSHSRISSIADIACNLIGTAIGVILYTPESIVTRKLLPAIESEIANRTTALAATAWAFVIFATALAPFDFTFDISLIGHSIRSAQFIPFDNLNHLTTILKSDPGNITAAITLWNLRFDYLLDIILFATFAALFTHHARTINRQRSVNLAATIVASTALAIAVTIAPLVVMSVDLDATRLITRLSGAIPVAIFAASRKQQPPTRALDKQRRFVTCAIAASIAYITARQLVPFQTDLTHLPDRIANIEWLPFHSYSLAKLPAAIADIAQKSFQFITLGALIAAHRLLAGHRLPNHHVITFSLIVAAFVAILELAQCALPGRVPATTDVLIAAILTHVGLHAGKLLHNTYRQQRITRAAEQTEVRQAQSALNIPIPPPVTHEPDLHAIPRPTPQNQQQDAKTSDVDH